VGCAEDEEMGVYCPWLKREYIEFLFRWLDEIIGMEFVFVGQQRHEHQTIRVPVVIFWNQCSENGVLRGG
jgi:hypothetical protein